MRFRPVVISLLGRFRLGYAPDHGLFEKLDDTKINRGYLEIYDPISKRICCIVRARGFEIFTISWIRHEQPKSLPRVLGAPNVDVNRRVLVG